jgi:CheY-like chemotaxis protein
MADAAKTVLVVDDDPDAREFLTTVLNDNGFATATANDGAEAIAMIEQSAPALVALDITMPEKSGVAVYRSEKSGVAVYRRIKEDEELKGIPVIIITGVSDDFKKFISTRRQVPAPEGYISKPVDHAELVKMVSELLA